MTLRMFYRSQSELIGQLVRTLLSLQDNCHPLVKRSAIKVLHHLSDWINSHQETIGLFVCLFVVIQ